MLKVIGFDLDGTLTQHRTPLPPASRELLDRLRRRYRVLIVGAGNCPRILRQIENYPLDVIGNYGMQYCRYDPETGLHRQVFDLQIPLDRESVTDRISRLRREHGYTEYAGDGVEFHSSGCVTFPLLGTKADIRDKLAFDPDRSRRRAIYEDVKAGRPVEKEKFKAVARELMGKGAEVIILGCTELSVIAQEWLPEKGVYLDVLDVLSRACVERFGKLKSEYLELL